MTDTIEARAIGRGLPRRDGPAKVTGAATYAYETPVEHPAYCHPVQATVPRGQVTSVDTGGLQGLEGVLATLTPEHSERLARTDDSELAVLQGADVAFRGQIVAAVVADTAELARQAADLVRVDYQREA